MKIDRFNKVVQDQLEYSASLLVTKGNEYVKGSDRLAAFKKAGALQNETPEQALLGMLAKHLVSISDMCVANAGEPLERWVEKITDSINYLILLRALVEEGFDNEANRSQGA